jgi:hypothetical protein
VPLVQEQITNHSLKILKKFLTCNTVSHPSFFAAKLRKITTSPTRG